MGRYSGTALERRGNNSKVSTILAQKLRSASGLENRICAVFARQRCRQSTNGMAMCFPPSTQPKRVNTARRIQDEGYHGNGSEYARN